MITISLNVTRIDKTAIVDGKNGKYLSLCLFANKNGPDQFGNDGFVTQDLGKERRLAGEKGPILGNYRDFDRQKAESEKPEFRSEKQDDDDIPF